MASQPIDPKDEDLLEIIQLDRDDPQDAFAQRLLAILRENPALAKRYEEIRRRDAEIGNRLKQGNKLSGLEERILARLGYQNEATDNHLGSSQTLDVAHPESGALRSSLYEGGASPVVTSRVVTGAPVPRVGRRQWLRWVGALATAGAVGGLGIWVWQRRKEKPRISALALGNAATELFEATLDGFGTGRLLGRENPPQGYRLSRDVQVFRGTVITWRQVTLADLPAIVFDLSHPGGEKGSLFVIRLVLPDLPPMPPRRPCLRTSRSSAGWWQDNDLACVLVVLGGPRVYERFLAPPAPLT